MPTWRRDAVDAVVWCGCLYAVALWTHGGGVHDLTGADDAFTSGAASASVGRLTGLLASVVIMAHITLAARLPWVEQALGERGLTLRLRVVATWGASFLVAHAVFVAAGYGAQTATRTVGAGADLITESWILALAVPGPVGVIAVAVVVASRIRSAIPYRLWRSLHVVTFAALGLGIPHQVVVGADFAGAPVHAATWLLAWTGAYGALLWYRVWVPWRTTERLGLRVTAVELVAPGLRRVRVAGRVGRVPAHAGQYFVWRFGPSGRRPSVWASHTGIVAPLAATPTGSAWDVLLPGGRALTASPTPGAAVWVEGPYGAVHSGIRDWTHAAVVVVAAGIGTAAARAAVQAIAPDAVSTCLVVRASDADDPQVHDLRAHCAAHNVRLVVIPGRFPTDASSWLPATDADHALTDATALTAVAPDIATSDVLVFGPPGWAGAVCAAALTSGADDGRVHSEIFHEVISPERETP